MASESPKGAGTAQDDCSTVCRLASLQKRPQLDFEIEFYERILSRDPNYLEVLLQLGDLFARKGCDRRALQVDLRLSQLRPRDARVFYNLACSHAVLRHKVEALASLQRAVSLGYDDVDHLSSDPDLESLHGEPEYRRIVARLESLQATTRAR
ncbi:MAG: TPR end-of-group domain-containing protein [Planctomycetaceae bacterium]